MVLELERKQIFLKVRLIIIGLFCLLVLNDGAIYSQSVGSENSILVTIDGQFEGDANSVALNDAINFIIDIKIQGDELDQFEFENPKPRFNQLRLLNTEQKVEAKPESKEKVYRFIYNLQPEEEGPASVGKLYFEYKDSTDDDFVKKPMNRVNIMITPPKYNYTGTIYKVLGGVGAALALVLVVIYIGPLLKREKSNHSGDLQDSPYERFQAELFILKAKLDQDQVQDYFAKSEKWLRNLISVAFGKNLTAATFPELQLLLGSLNSEHSDWIETILQIAKKCEDVKFAGYVPTHGEKQDLYLQCEEILKYAIQQNPKFDLGEAEENEDIES